VSQNRASPQGVAARIGASFVARLANTGSIGCTSLRAIANSVSQRTRVSSCYGLPEGTALSTELRESDLATGIRGNCAVQSGARAFTQRHYLRALS